MRIYIYTGGEKLVSKSGVGQAIRHQQEMLRRAGVDTTEHWTADTAAVHVNTVLGLFAGSACRPDPGPEGGLLRPLHHAGLPQLL